LNPFDLKSALLAKHAQHVVLIHFPIALFLASFAFDLLARGRRDRKSGDGRVLQLDRSSDRHTAGGHGLIAWRWLLERQKLKGDLWLHLLFGSLSAGMI
jgi:hypothetical protein